MAKKGLFRFQRRNRIILFAVALLITFWAGYKLGRAVENQEWLDLVNSIEYKKNS